MIWSPAGLLDLGTPSKNVPTNGLVYLIQELWESPIIKYLCGDV